MKVETVNFWIENPRYELLTSREIRLDRMPGEPTLGALILLDVECKNCDRAWQAHRGDGLRQTIGHVHLECACGVDESVPMEKVRMSQLG
jgi:hypothetical protein